MNEWTDKRSDRRKVKTKIAKEKKKSCNLVVNYFSFLFGFCVCTARVFRSRSHSLLCVWDFLQFLLSFIFCSHFGLRARFLATKPDLGFSWSWAQKRRANMIFVRCFTKGFVGFASGFFNSAQKLLHQTENNCARFGQP